MISRILASSHMRVLVFSWSEVTSVRVKVDEEEWQEMARAQEPAVYSLAWDPQDYTGAQHKLRWTIITKLYTVSLNSTTPSISMHPNLLVTTRVMVTMVDDFGETSTKEIVQKFVVDTASLQSIEYNLYARSGLYTCSSFLHLLPPSSTCFLLPPPACPG